MYVHQARGREEVEEFKTKKNLSVLIIMVSLMLK